MITSFRKFGVLMVLAAVAVGCGDVGDAPKAKTGEEVAVDKTESAGTVLAINPSASKVNWNAAKVTKSHEGGFKDVTGTVTVEGGKLARVEVNVPTGTIFSDDEKLTGHLKSPDFFDAANHPTAKFEASSFTEQSDSAGNTHTVTGNLTIRGVTHGVTFPAKVNVTEGKVTATADFIINRQDWKITYPGMPDDLIKDDVRIILDIVADAPAGAATASAPATGTDTAAASAGH